MAGGKETPRQKMIGMMYLVLTALLALQVNSAILLKFKFIDDSLTDVNAKTDKAAEGTIKGIQEAVAKNRNQAADQAVLKQSEEIRYVAASWGHCYGTPPCLSCCPDIVDLA